MSKRKSKAEREREARVQAKYTKADEAVLRTERRMVRAFGAWQRAVLLRRRIIKSLERPTEPPLGEGPGVQEILDDTEKLGLIGPKACAVPLTDLDKFFR
jgi:hypothetical protein